MFTRHRQDGGLDLYTAVVLRYAITDATRAGGTAEERRQRLQAAARRWAAQGVDFVQLREKTLAAGELLALAEMLKTELTRDSGQTQLLINARADVAMAAGAAGVHLPAARGELTPTQVRAIFASAGDAAGRAEPVISVSCHTAEDTARARDAGAGWILFGPVFEKVVGGMPAGGGSGLDRLREAAEIAGTIPVLALGGITDTNTAECLQAGAAGVAGIRLFA